LVVEDEKENPYWGEEKKKGGNKKHIEERELPSLKKRKVAIPINVPFKRVEDGPKEANNLQNGK